MIYLITIGMVILFFIILDKNDKIKILQRKIKQLEKEIEKLKLQRKNCENSTDNALGTVKDNVIKTEKSLIKDDINLIKNEKIESKKNDEKTQLNNLNKKNSNILATGAALIVLAAIVFLTSTWEIISNPIKTVILILVMFVFLGASKIANEKFNLKKTSETFFNISMAYLPICLISISVFGLLGEFLSIYGEGKFIYFFLSAIGLAFLYYRLFKNKNRKNLLISSILSQITSLICLSCIFEVRLDLIGIVLLLYNFLLIIYTKDELFKIVQKIILYSVSGCVVFFIITSAPINSVGILEVILLVLITINYFVLCKIYKTTELAIATNISLIFSGIFLFKFELLNIPNSFLIYLNILWIISTFIFNNIIISNKNYLQINTIVSAIMLLVVGLEYNFEYIKSYIYLVIEATILLVAYKRDLFDKRIGLEMIITGIYVLAGWVIIYELSLNNIAFIIFSDIVFFISLFIKNENWKRSILIISHIAIVAAIANWCANDLENELYSIYIYVLSIIVYLLSYLKYRYISIFKYASYISMLLTLVMVNSYFNLELAYLIIPICVYVITILETVYKNKIKDYYSEYAIFVFYIISYVALLGDISFISMIFGIVNTIVLIILDVYYNQKSRYSYIGCFGLLSITTFIENSNILFLIIGLVFSLLSLTKFLNKKEFTIFSAIYLIIFLLISEAIIGYLILFIWSILHCFVYKENKYLFQTSTCVVGTLLYMEILYLMELREYVWLILVGIEIFALLFFKTVAKNKWENHEELEYVFFSIVYIWALISYSSVFDGMISVGIMIAIIIFAYSKRYGSTVVMNLVAIIINAIGLTREFWFMIPWWGYLLGIGIALVAFAVKNEVKEQKINNKNILKSIKENCDKK